MKSKQFNFEGIRGGEAEVKGDSSVGNALMAKARKFNKNTAPQEDRAVKY